MGNTCDRKAEGEWVRGKRRQGGGEGQEGKMPTTKEIYKKATMKLTTLCANFTNLIRNHHGLCDYEISSSLHPETSCILTVQTADVERASSWAWWAHLSCQHFGGKK
jgi:hypothetical protein